MHRAIGRAALTALVLLALAAFLSPFPAVASSAESDSGWNDDDGDSGTGVLDSGASPAGLPVSGPGLHAPIRCSPAVALVPASVFERPPAEEIAPRSPPRD